MRCIACSGDIRELDMLIGIFPLGMLAAELLAMPPGIQLSYLGCILPDPNISSASRKASSSSYEQVPASQKSYSLKPSSRKVPTQKPSSTSQCQHHLHGHTASKPSAAPDRSRSTSSPYLLLLLRATILSNQGDIITGSINLIDLQGLR